MNRYFCISFLLATLLFATAGHTAKLPPEARQAMHKAQVLMDKKQYTEAARLLNGFLQSAEEKPADTFMMLGGAYHLSGNKKKALGAFESGLAAHPDNPDLTLNCAIICYESKRFAKAGEYFQKTYDLKRPPNPKLLYQSGAAYYEAEQFDASATVMTRLIAMVKKPDKQWIQLAVHALLEAKRVGQARSMLMRYLAANPNEAPYWKILARLNLDSGKYMEGAAALEICHRIKKPSRQELEQLASLYAYVDAPLMAAATLKRAYPGAPSATQARKLASLMAKAGRTTLAVRQLDASPEKAKLAGEKGQFLYEARRFDEAEAALKHGLSASARPDMTRFYLAMCAWERQDWKTSKAHLTQIRKDKEYRQRASASLAVIEGLEDARREAEE